MPPALKPTIFPASAPLRPAAGFFRLDLVSAGACKISRYWLYFAGRHGIDGSPNDRAKVARWRDRHPLSIALPDQYARPGDRTVERAWPAGGARRYSGSRVGCFGRKRLRLDLAAQRVANRAGRAAELALRSRVAPRTRRDHAGAARRGYSRLRFRHNLL